MICRGWRNLFPPKGFRHGWFLMMGLQGEVDLSCLSDRPYAEAWHNPGGFVSVRLEAGVPVWGDEELSPSYLKELLQKTLQDHESASHHSRTLVG